jgi:hypothetical protein
VIFEQNYLRQQMKTLIIHPGNRKQSAALKGFFKAFDIYFEEGKSSYDPKFVEMIRQGDNDLNAGKGIKVDIDNIFVEKVEKGLQDIERGNIRNYESVKSSFLNN